MDSNADLVELDQLVSLFFDSSSELGQFKLVEPDEVPEPQRSLLNHDHHMTVTVEKFHSSPVDVVVLQEHRNENFYSREICLNRQSDHQTVQYGIVRLNFNHLDEPVQAEILDKSKPLGRILIENEVLRCVRLLSLYRVSPADVLRSKLQFDMDVYGRTAIIYCNQEPAIELLEIVRV